MINIKFIKQEFPKQSAEKQIERDTRDTKPFSTPPIFDKNWKIMDEIKTT